MTGEAGDLVVASGLAPSVLPDEARRLVAALAASGVLEGVAGTGHGFVFRARWTGERRPEPETGPGGLSLLFCDPRLRPGQTVAVKVLAGLGWHELEVARQVAELDHGPATVDGSSGRPGRRLMTPSAAFGSPGGPAVLVTPWSGESLKSWLEKVKADPARDDEDGVAVAVEWLQRLVDVVGRAALTLEFVAEEFGRVHGDVTDEHVRMDAPALIDFGSSRTIGEADLWHGSRGWMDPRAQAPSGGAGRVVVASEFDVWPFGKLLGNGVHEICDHLVRRGTTPVSTKTELWAAAEALRELGTACQSTAVLSDGSARRPSLRVLADLLAAVSGALESLLRDGPAQTGAIGPVGRLLSERALPLLRKQAVPDRLGSEAALSDQQVAEMIDAMLADVPGAAELLLNARPSAAASGRPEAHEVALLADYAGGVPGSQVRVRSSGELRAGQPVWVWRLSRQSTLVTWAEKYLTEPGMYESGSPLSRTRERTGGVGRWKEGTPVSVVGPVALIDSVEGDVVVLVQQAEHVTAGQWLRAQARTPTVPSQHPPEEMLRSVLWVLYSLVTYASWRLPSGLHVDRLALTFGSDGLPSGEVVLAGAVRPHLDAEWDGGGVYPFASLRVVSEAESAARELVREFLDAVFPVGAVRAQAASCAFVKPKMFVDVVEMFRSRAADMASTWSDTASYGRRDDGWLDGLAGALHVTAVALESASVFADDEVAVWDLLAATERVRRTGPAALRSPDFDVTQENVANEHLAVEVLDRVVRGRQSFQS